MSQLSILQPDPDQVRGDHYLPVRVDEVFWGRLPCAADRPILTVDPGESVTIDTLSHEGLLEDQGSDPVAYFSRHGVAADAVLSDAVDLVLHGGARTAGVDGPHVVTGPIAVRGAQPGDLLVMEVVELLPRVPYGVISNRHGRGALPGEFPLQGEAFSVFARAAETGDGLVGSIPFAEGSDRTARFGLAPFLGVMGVAVAGDDRPHSVPPGAFGGNIDIKLLTEGARLLLPVQVPGANAYIGDPHFAQGDGEVALTAMEASLRATIRFDVIPADQALEQFGRVTGPLVQTHEFLVPTGLHEDLDEAVRLCVRASIDLLEARFGMDRSHALAYLSAATDFDISQVVDVVKGVHAKIRVGDLG
ncbi:acetamidase/formamidase family protein [Herbiconiux sp. L3-i23]|uniref:acetamidase/formamidase family protein n=1 Tax=Herbiconiux sp. L3-i23 TaxID=2905871 RepID=UPI002050ADB3|nr:acetamidase/formamidase family protein [Herbiconiux sp. L3-i23]BDI21407.1 formamidase [Herbiconiux sp. L3-i23]